ncbi:MAG: hypothetical protein AAFO94_12145 [Bacteroidota bacterium]
MKRFSIQLTAISVGTMLLLVLFQQMADVRSYPNFAWLCLGFFIVFSIVMYFFGWRTSLSSDRNAFTRTIIGFMGLKMFFSVLLVATYVKLVEPDSKYFLIPFFIVYLIFTVFETYFMSRLGRIKPNS